MFFSFIIPVFNRPDEVEELLESLTKQSVKDFEVLIVEDGSSVTCEKVCKKYEGHVTTAPSVRAENTLLY